MKTVMVKLDYLDKVGAIIVGDYLPILLDNNPNKVIGSCKVIRNNEGAFV